MGSAAHATPAPGAPWARGQCFGTPLSPVTAESGVLPLLPGQQRSEKPSALITLMQVRAGGWEQLPLRAASRDGPGCDGLSRAEPGWAELGSCSREFRRAAVGPSALAVPMSQARVFWGDPRLPSHVTARAVGT